MRSLNVEQVLAAAFDRAPIGMSVLDLDGRWLRVNDAYCAMFGYDRDELLGMDFRDLTHVEDVGDYASLIARAEAGDVASAQRVRRYVARDGSIVWVNLRTEVICDDRGRPAYTLSLLEDITQRRRVEVELRRSDTQLRKAEEMVGVGSWEFSLDDETVTWSAGFYRIHGLQAGVEQLRSDYVNAVHADDRLRFAAGIQRLVREDRASFEYRIVRPDGAVRTLSVEGERVDLGEGRTGVRGAALDVTDERAGFDAAPIGMLVTEPAELRVLRANDALCTMLGRTRDQLLGMRVEELTHPDDRPSADDGRRALAAGTITSHQEEKRYLHPDGSVLWVAIYVTPLHNADGSVRAYSSQIIDLTERRTRDAQIQSARVESLRKLAIASEYRDNDTHEHTERVARIAVEIGRKLGMDPADLELLREAAPLHDIGKIGISDAILLKPGRLTAGERRDMQRHTLIGADILSGSESPVLMMAEEIALTHHERWDGEGYPHGHAGEAIALVGRVVAAADVFDALTHSRPYKRAWPVAQAMAQIREQRGRQFDPAVVDAFATLDLAAPAFSHATPGVGHETWAPPAPDRAGRLGTELGWMQGDPPPPLAPFARARTRPSARWTTPRPGASPMGAQRSARG